MSYKTILVNLNEISQLRCLVDSAGAIGARSGAHVVGLYVIPAVQLVMSGEVAVLPAEDDRERTYYQAQEAAVRRAFEEAMRAAGLQGEFRVVDAPRPAISPVVIEEARQTDLVIIGHSNSASGSAIGAEFTETVLMESGRPTLVMSVKGCPLIPGSLALVGWNDSREAARAVFDSVPLLQCAAEVLIATVVSEEESAGREEAPLELLKTLLRHGVRATRLNVPASEEEGLALMTAAENRGAGLLVMGGYGHARLREFILGGATRSVLKRMTIPVLFSH